MEWDESLYATSAYEMLESGNWVVTTFDGATDYYNSKPPLNVWLIALSMKAFGPSLTAMRLPSIVAAWLTVAVLLLWATRRFGSQVALLAGAVLATCFGFLHVHSGRSDNPDALMTLFLLLIVVVLDASSERPWRRIWLGPLLSGVFLLKGPAIFMPVLLVLIIETQRQMDRRSRWLPLIVALLIGAIPVLAWGVLRWRADGISFFERMFVQDFWAVSTRTIENQDGSNLFYLNILIKHHYDWVAAGLAVLVLFPPTSWRAAWDAVAFWRSADDRIRILGYWSAVALLIPTVMRTNLPWYINPLYPTFALAIGGLLAYGLSRRDETRPQLRTQLIAVVLVAGLVAEGKLIWYSYTYRSLDRSAQGLLLAEAGRVSGGRVFGRWNRADAIVLKCIVRAKSKAVADAEEFLRVGEPGDYLVLPIELEHGGLSMLATDGRHALYRHD